MHTLIYEAVPPVGPVFVPALMGLFLIAAIFFAIGLLKMLDAFSRALFGTVSGAVGWIPFAGKVVKHSLHKIEQKISHGIGSAERKLDAAAALSWHNMARLVSFVGQEIAGAAVATWQLAQQAKAFVRGREMNQSIRSGVKPVKAQSVSNARSIHNLSSEQAALHRTVGSVVLPRVKTAEWEIEHVLEPSIAGLRARTKALENGGTRLWRWLRTHPKTIATGAFVGAVAFALTRLGGGWIRCANWRKLGKTVCRMPSPLIDALIAALIAEVAIANLDTLMHFAEDAMDEVTRGVYHALGLGDLPHGQFTVE